MTPSAPWRTPEYEAYHAKVVDACCELMGEDSRAFWDKQCTFEEEFAENRDPHEVAETQREYL